MSDLEIYCDADGDDKLTLISDRTGLYVEATVPCIRLNVETAQQLAEALIEWANQQLAEVPAEGVR